MGDLKQRIEAANQEALRRLVSARPMLVDMAPAEEVVPGLRGRRLHHAGPPITARRLCGAQRGGLICAILAEGWAQDAPTAFAMLERGEIELAPNHEHDSVGPMAGVISPRTFVWVIQDAISGKTSFAPEQQQAAIFGCYDEPAVRNRRFVTEVAGPVLKKALAHTGPINLMPIMAQALHMGDELHNRNEAASALLFRELSVGLFRAGGSDAERTAAYLAGQHWLFLPMVMAASKAMSMAAHGIEYSTVATTMCRNGVEFGLRVSGLGDAWFVGPAQKVQGPYLPGYSDADAGLDIGDSSAVELIGVGAFALAAAPAMLSFTGGTIDEALAIPARMRQITVGENPLLTIPILNHFPAPTGIDIRKVLQTGILPLIDTAMSHREPGHQIVGAGLVTPPMNIFADAVRAFAARYPSG
jgi:hypothetical protein